MELNLITLVALAVVLVIGAVVGVGLGRRSSTANAYYDRARKEIDELRERLRETEAQLRSKGQ